MAKNNSDGDSLSEILKIRKEIENEDKIFYEELPQKYILLEGLDLEQLKKLCTEYLGRLPPVEHFKDEKTGNDIKLPTLKEDYIHLIIEEMRLSEIKKHVDTV